jgi:hypothetical protein
MLKVVILLGYILEGEHSLALPMPSMDACLARQEVILEHLRKDSDTHSYVVTCITLPLTSKGA